MTEQPWNQPPFRIGDSEREAAAARLKTHLDAGRLTTTEFAERVVAAEEARTQPDLDSLFTDLPPVVGGTFEVYPHQSMDLRQPGAVASEPEAVDYPPAPGPPYSRAPHPVWGNAIAPPVLTIVAIVAMVLLAIIFMRLGAWWVLFFLWPMARFTRGPRGPGRSGGRYRKPKQP